MRRRLGAQGRFLLGLLPGKADLARARQAPGRDLLAGLTVAIVALPAKREVVSRLLGDGPILIHLDARRPGVSVPATLASDPRLVLRFGHGLTPAIADLDIGDDGVSGTLSFGGVPHCCVLPWSAIYAVVSEVDQRGMVWPDDVPPEAMSTSDEAAPAGEQTASASPPARRGRATHLKLVE